MVALPINGTQFPISNLTRSPQARAQLRLRLRLHTHSHRFATPEFPTCPARRLEASGAAGCWLLAAGCWLLSWLRRELADPLPRPWMHIGCRDTIRIIMELDVLNNTSTSPSLDLTPSLVASSFHHNPYPSYFTFALAVPWSLVTGDSAHLVFPIIQAI